MKRSVIVLLLVAISSLGMAQKIEYQTFIYTSDDLADEIARQSGEQGSERGYWGDLFNASKESVKGIASGYVTSFIDLGVNAIGSLVTRNARLKAEWEETVQAENVYTTQISTVSEVNDFYKETSLHSAMDPKGMRFDGIGCLRKEGSDTLFYISCHIDRNKINRIINHSKFGLVLDTLIVSPAHSNLPNTSLDIPYSFEERTNFTFYMNIKLTSSWMTDMALLQKNQELGEFSINIPVDRNVIGADGFLRYVRKEGEQPAYKILGESFIVPRSYMGYRDENDRFRNRWGTGEYKLSIKLKETCDVTQQYRDNWKKDRKRRKSLQGQENLFASSWQSISSQRWDELTKSWIITTLHAPAEIITRDVIDKLGLDPDE